MKTRSLIKTTKISGSEEEIVSMPLDLFERGMQDAKAGRIQRWKPRIIRN